MKSQPTERPSLPTVIGMHCALLSLASGTVGLAVSFILWWRTVPREIARIGEQAGLFSAALGIVLASIGLASNRKSVRRLALLALCVNIAILSITLDTIFTFIR